MWKQYTIGIFWYCWQDSGSVRYLVFQVIPLSVSFWFRFPKILKLTSLLVTVPGGRPGEGGAESDSESEEPPPKKRSAGPGTSQPRGAPSPSRPVRQQEPDRDALQARYEEILAMPDSRRTVAERAEVRQILTVQLLERMLGGQSDGPDIVFL